MRFANFRVTVITKRKEKKKSKRATARVSMLTSSRHTVLMAGNNINTI